MTHYTSRENGKRKHSSVPKFAPKIAVLIAGYALLLLIANLTIPLTIPEILQLAGSRHYASLSLVQWIARTPGAAPLNYFVQLPFVLIFGYSRAGARLDSVLFAAGASYLFFRIARRVQLRWPLAATLVFVLLPLHLQLAILGRPFEQAMFLLLLATWCYFHVLERPGILVAALYGVLLLLCLYTDPFSYLPAVGYVVFLLRFIDRAQERRAVWFLLPATAAPPLLFLPYYMWARPQVFPYWLTQAPREMESSYASILQGFAGDPWTSTALVLLLLAGVAIGAWRTFEPAAGAIGRRILLFALFGGIVSTAGFVAFLNVWAGASFSAQQIFWTAPGAVILPFAATDWLASKLRIRWTAPAVAGLLVVLCVLGNLSSISNRTEDMQAEAVSVAQELTGDACVVFVSERMSRVLFVMFDPQLRSRECLNFFHKRVVLASHPYVTPNQQQSAETFFKGLNFSEVKRMRVGGGQIIVLEQGI